MVSKASEDLPEPDRPVITTRRSRGISRSMFLRLCSRAPLMIIRSAMLASRSLAGLGNSCAAAGCARGILERGDHAAGVRHAAPGDIEAGAVVGRGANEGK